MKTKTGYAYSYQDPGCVELPHTSTPPDASWTIQLKFPRLSSMRWLLKLYGLVMSGLGIILSLAWSCFHIFVLTVTNLQELRQQRYLDITLGIMLTVSMVCLLYGSYSLLPSPLIIFFSLSLTVVLSYWLWYLYTNYIMASYPVFEEQLGKIGLTLTLIYLLLMSPVVLLYREIQTETSPNTLISYVTS